ANGVVQTHVVQKGTQRIEKAPVAKPPGDGTARMEAQTPTQTIRVGTGRNNNEYPGAAHEAVPSSVIPRHVLMFSIVGLVVLFSAGIFIGMSMSHSASNSSAV